ncbi:hypothetical protein GCM10009424_30650 [Sphingomonas ursincola]
MAGEVAMDEIGMNASSMMPWSKTSGRACYRADYNTERPGMALAKPAGPDPIASGTDNKGCDAPARPPNGQIG